MSYFYNRQTHPSSCVEHSLYCRFYNLQERNLVIATNNQIKIYRLINDGDHQQPASGGDGTNPASTDPAAPTTGDESTSVKAKLEFLQSFSFFGTITCLQSVAFNGSNRDSLLMAFAEAKLSLVEYDPTTHDLKTLSMHYFEDEDMKDGHTNVPELSILRVDPENRCAALLVYGRNIIILPFRKDAINTAAVVEDNSLIQPEPAAPVKSESTDSKQQASSGTFIATTVRSPVLASYRLNLSDEHYAGEKINNIIDIEFLEGYYEPTLLILHEPVKTWSGRLAVRQDTVAMVALSLNVHQRVHPIIWSTSNLPFDCWRAMAVPKPVGGVLIMAANSLTYLNQSVPPYSVSLNGFTENSTAFPMIVQKGVKLSLDCSHCCFISNDKLVISLKGGELYVLTLFNDGMRSIRTFHFEKAASSVMATTIVLCEPGYIFLGSSLGNSMLLKYIEKPVDLSEKEALPEEEEQPNADDDIDTSIAKVDQNGDEEPAIKKIKRDPIDDEAIANDDLGEWLAGDVALMKDDEALEVYGPEENSEEKLPTTLAFEVCDTIINIGPCARVCMGEPAFVQEEFAVADNTPHVELVTTSGYAKNGALSVLQRTVRPQIATTFPLPKCVDMWTVYGSPSEEPSVQNAQAHSYLIFSREDSTTVLKTGQEIKELDECAFGTSQRTILAGNLGKNRYIVQILTKSIRLLEGNKELQNLALDLGSPIAQASLADPYAVIMAQNGSLIRVMLKQEGNSARLVTTKFPPQPRTKLLAICLYRDTSGIFTTESLHKEGQLDPAVVVKTEPTEAMDTSTANPVDDEDDLLYGDSAVEIGGSLALGMPGSAGVGNDGTSVNIRKVVEAPATYWMFLARENGVLEISNLLDFKTVYYIKNFPMVPKVLVDSVQSTDQTSQQQPAADLQTMPKLRELLVTGLGCRRSRPMLFSRFDDQIFIYEIFPYHETNVEGHLKIRFKKLTETVILRDYQYDDEQKQQPQQPQQSQQPQQHLKQAAKSGTSSDSAGGAGGGKESAAKKDTTSANNVWFRTFNDVSGYAGVFLCGPYPCWFFMGTRGELRHHDMPVDGAVISFAPFHNLNCTKGFLYINKKGDLRIATLPTQVSYDAPWPVRKVPLRVTAHFINYHVESKCYCVVTSTLEKFDKIIRVGGDEKDYETLERDERYIWPSTEKFSLQLFSPVSWEFIPGTKIDLEEWEHVTCIKNVSLASEGTESGLKGYVAVGTNYCYGEDVTNRGRIWILDIIEVVPEPGQPLTKNKIKIMYNKEQKGPVTALTQVRGFLLSAIGQKIYIWQLKEAQLVGIAFIDTNIYIHSAVSIKNLILISDIYKSISLLRYQEETRTLALVSRDIRNFEVYGSDFVIDHNQLSFVVSDGDGNFLIYSYCPELRESYGGTRLVRKADYHIGSLVNSFFRIRTKPPPVRDEAARVGRDINKQMTVYATLDGGLGYLLPMSEKMYRRFLMLQNVMTTYLQHGAGLNPKAYRQFKTSQKSLENLSKNIVDGDLLNRFLTLSLTEKAEMTRRIGTTPTQIIDDLHEIERATAHF